MRDMYHPTTDRLEAFVEGGLDEAERVVVESHLMGCPRCETEVEDWRALFVTLSGLASFEPSPGFADRVMAGVRYAPRAAWSAAWQERATRAGQALTRLAPQSSFGWALATALMSLPVILGGGTVAWLLQKEYITPQGLWAMASQWAVEGVQGIGSTAITAVLQTDVAVWLVERTTAFVNTAGMGGLGVVIGTAGVATVLSIWVLYRNLIRTPERESHYVSYSF
jgi:hypothetical protein